MWRIPNRISLLITLFAALLMPICSFGTAPGSGLPFRSANAGTDELSSADWEAIRGQIEFQQAYLKASNSDEEDQFGFSLSVYGDTVVVGAFGEASSAVGAGGEQDDNSALSSGAAYIFFRSGSNWTQQAYLKASNSDANDWFGRSVAIYADTVVVGAPHESSNATGVNGDQNDNSAMNAGAAYVFVRDGTDWSQQAYLKASNTDSGDWFGTSIAVYEDTVVVGAPYEYSNATGVNGNEDNNLAMNAGAAYVFIRDGAEWSQQAYLKASNTNDGDRFGLSVGVYGDTVLIGADGEDSSSTGVDGNQDNNLASDSGAAYVFVRNGSSWSQQAYLKASNTGNNDWFGRAVGIYGNTAVVGAPFEDSSSIGVGGNQGDNSSNESGATYVFVRNGSVWSQQAYLKASNTDSGDWFGRSVAVYGERILVGARAEASNATGLDGEEGNNSAINAGAAYMFVRNGSSWSQRNYLKASNTGSGDWFGQSVAVYADIVLVGANGEESGSNGVDGEQDNNSAPNSGAAYIFGPQLYTVGGTVSGLAGTGLALRNNGVDELHITANGQFTFNTRVFEGSTYIVKVAEQPTSPSQTCVVKNHSGTVINQNVSDIFVICSGTIFHDSFEAVSNP